MYSQPLKAWKGVNLQSANVNVGFNVLKANNIKNNTDGPEMNLNYLKPGHYNFTVWVKASNLSSGSSYFLAAIRSPGQAVTAGRVIATGLAKTHCWTKVQGGFTLLKGAKVLLKMGGMPANSVMLLSSVTVGGVDLSTYIQQKNAVIDQIRKRDVSLNIIDKFGNPFVGFVEVDQTESDFAFGGSASGAIIVSNAYRRWFKKHFNWAVYENEAKWYYTEGNQGVYTYQDPDRMTSIFASMNITLRGHNVLWDDPNYANYWLKNLPASQVIAAVNTRVQDVVTRYKGKFKHWDVINEMLHGQFFESATGDKNYSAKVYRAVKDLDPDVMTFVNDYNIIETYGSISAAEQYLAEIANLEANGGPVDGIGLESHFQTVDAPRMKVELDLLATAGKPVWLTELDVSIADPQSQADNFELAMREAFAHPSVHGIMVWGPARPNCTTTPWSYIDPGICGTPLCSNCLSNDNFEERPVGLRHLTLRKEWMTYRSRSLTDGVFDFRGFFGQYVVRGHQNGTVTKQSFYLPNGTSLFSATIQLS